MHVQTVVTISIYIIQIFCSPAHLHVLHAESPAVGPVRAARGHLAVAQPRPLAVAETLQQETVTIRIGAIDNHIETTLVIITPDGSSPCPAR